eukprot:NODE_394_length_8135_cov_0.672847.p3 type:complete len:175 gc:universal NODE_394_length_8135_cov_0.672847:7108-7632(+)
MSLSFPTTDVPLTLNCQIAYGKAYQCKTKAGESPICSSCGSLTEALLTQCAVNDFKDLEMTDLAMQCHQEGGEYCIDNPKFKMDVKLCQDRCSQFYSKMRSFASPSMRAALDPDQVLLRCGYNYPNTTQIGYNPFQNQPITASTAASNGTKTDSNSAASGVTFSVLTLATLMLI